MKRYVSPDLTDPPDTEVLPIAAGGTGARTRIKALENLGGIPLSSIDKPNGVVGLDNAKKVRRKVLRTNSPGGVLVLDPVTKLIPPTVLPVLDTVSPTLSGPKEVFINDIGVFEITNADIAQTYHVVALSGSVVVNGDRVIYTGGDTPGQGGFLINGRKIPVSILAKGFGTPSLLLPVNGSLVDSGSVVLSMTPYTVVGNATIKDDASRWQFSKDKNFTVLTNEIVTSGVTSVYTFRDAQAGTRYYARARYEAADGTVSGWTPYVSFETKVINIDGPVETFVGKPTVFTILNYVSTATYALDLFGGIISRTNNKITYTPPSTPGQYGFRINGQTVSLSVIADGVVTPVIISPLAGAGNLTDRFTIFSTPFAVSTGSDTHISSTFQLSTDPNFNTVVAESVDSSKNLTSWQVGNLTAGTSYFIRVRYKSLTYGYSKWSDVRTVYTKANFTPSLELGWLTPSNTSVEHSYGNSISMSGDGNTVVIGDKKRSRSDVSGTYESAVYVYSVVNGIYTESSIIYPTAYLGLNHSPTSFGSSVSISNDGTVLAVGYPESYSGSGSVLILKKNNNNWLLDGILQITSNNSSYGLGTKVKISGDGSSVLVGNSIKDGFRVYKRLSSGIWQNTLTVVNPNLGASTVNYYGDIVTSSTLGSKTIRRHSLLGTTWHEETNIVLSKLGLNYTSELGSSIESSDNGKFIILTDPGLDKGSVVSLSYTDMGWSEALIKSPAFGFPSRFGDRVSLSNTGDTLIVADPTEKRYLNGVLRSVGGAYVFTKKAGLFMLENDVLANELGLLANSDVTGDIRFGESVSISRNGARAGISATGTKSGVVFIYG